MIRSLIAPLLLIAAVGTDQASAEPIAAPLPSGYEASGQPSSNGVYAEVTKLYSIDHAQQIEDLTASCAAKGKPVAIEGQELVGTGAWRIYRTARQVAEISDSISLDTDDQACTARYGRRRHVIVSKGDVPFEQMPGFTDPAFSCGKFGRISRCKQRTIAGIEVTCLDEGDGLVGSYKCVSRREDLSKGLLVAAGSYRDDSAVAGSWELERVLLDVAIDPVVFTSAR